jgi:MoaA/NifB/PqqE/SkfB family radical SAM enzyme
LSGSGEPTLHPRLVEFVQLARRVRNVGVIGFASNGVALTPELSAGLLEGGLTRLKVSLDTDDPGTYRRLNGADVYENVVANITRFCELNHRMGNPCRVTVKVTLYDRDLGVARRLSEKWSPLVDQVRVTPLHNWGGLKGQRAGEARHRVCAMPWQQVQILWDGQITLCCLDSMEGSFNMGSAFDLNLTDYWRGDERLREIRRFHEAGDFSTLPVCARCNADTYADISLPG